MADSRRLRARPRRNWATALSCPVKIQLPTHDANGEFMTETRTLTDIGRTVHDRLSLLFGAPEAPDLMLYHAALLIGDEEPRYVELVWRGS